ncbi:hypothetical protein Stsp02_54650 [Streptomyces sp. NBRC 14336]|uniref:LmeA family phospholipid-binding protein n=1 Tax=Streptomyces sp. NBRC 14336 TaxID=3030992 RepID=UPI0024A101B1|nr:DUF2993 domain-containing protein [Streptomyces sp. NBRC 14336]WBO78840.1 DUF2993 domain-containing protein [Streptomyces sp. SBE_14.2]GLW49804.1 hypothetical protein Stsp02_54650 [Streptomyces sp. NBRC 14336]
MRALRITLIIVVILGGLFVLADRLAVGFAEDEAAEKLKATENLAATPDVSINGFPFLTQVAGGELDDVEVGIDDYEASTGDGGKTIRIDGLKANMRGVHFSGDYSSATAASATGTATISYDELLKATKSEPTEVVPGVQANVVGLSDGGNGKIKVAVRVQGKAAGVLPVDRTLSVLSTVTVENNKVRVDADALPAIKGLSLAEDRVRSITDFQQAIDRLPGGIELDKVEAAKDGVVITVKGSDVRLAG